MFDGNLYLDRRSTEVEFNKHSGVFAGKLDITTG